eukprot:CAMPEP_0179366706 /NCGR_PEP_ID=MMETSP0797-20121207/83200_1 /TAXON_ID=47934 /ORGANISM="Dinophysis acuminata, Strain DAEP01" /LENGTH=111 /DNA_ID=CAMNT_0021082239 /DNA_START=363 /DNA_END=698 /DNA_ORIENTATION=+
MGLHNRSKYNLNGYAMYFNGFTWVYFNKVRWLIGLKPLDGRHWLQSERTYEQNPSNSPNWEVKIVRRWGRCYGFSIISVDLPFSPYNMGDDNPHRIDPWEKDIPHDEELVN